MRGVDRSAEVFLDARNITNADLQCSVAPADLATEVWAVGSSTDGTTAAALRSNTTLRATFGRVGVSETFDNTTDSLQGKADGILSARSGMLVVPGQSLMPVTDADVTDFDPGDLVSLSYDFGLGLVEAAHRVAEKRVQVSEDASVSISVAFG